MPLQVLAPADSPFSLHYSNLHPSADQWSCHSFASFLHCGLGDGFTSVLQMHFRLFVGFVFFFITGFDGARVSDVGLLTQPVRNESASDQKAAWFSCNTVFSNWHWVSIIVTCCWVSLGKPRAIISHLWCRQKWPVALLVLKIQRNLTDSSGVPLPG